jgi:hypothetical protein
LLCGCDLEFLEEWNTGDIKFFYFLNLCTFKTPII